MTKKFLIIAVMFLLIAIASPARAKTPTLSPTPSPSPESVQYDLAFPGILPDHPLFKLKVLRDKITAALTRDPEQKIRFYLRLADKGILATAMLLEKGKLDLANQTALKAEHNMTLVNSYLPFTTLRKDSELLAKIKTASRKHGEVLGVLINRLEPQNQSTLKTVLEFSQRNLATIEQFEAQSR